MKVLYIAEKYNPKYFSQGVERKIESQAKAMTKFGVSVDIQLFSRLSKLRRALPFQPSCFDWNRINVSQNVQGIYIRYQLADYTFIQFLKRIKKERPSIKIVVEIPTYPYDQEPRSPFLLRRDRIYRKRLKGLVDRIILIAGNQNTLWGVPVLNIYNGIDLENYKVRDVKNSDRKIRLLCVARFTRVHGIDRLLNGLDSYLKNDGSRSIEIFLAGEGEAKAELEKIVEETSIIQDNVHFLGHLDKEGLEKYYNECDLGIEILGITRAAEGMISSTLKSREYLAVGLPFVGTTEIDVFDYKSPRFYLKLPKGENPIDLQEIINFYDELYPPGLIEEKQKVANEMRQFAEETIDVSITMQPVINYFKNGD